jgi:hypothetical protein
MSKKTLTVQIQPDLLTSIEAESIVQLLEGLAKKNPHVSSSHTSRDKDTGRYINVQFVSDDLHELWTTIRQALFIHNSASAEIKKATVIVCTGKSGWKDYLLLHHYDSSEHLDSLPEKHKKR